MGEWVGQPKSRGANLTPPPPVSLSKGLVWVKGPWIKRRSSYTATDRVPRSAWPREVAVEVGVLLRSAWPI